RVSDIPNPPRPVSHVILHADATGLHTVTPVMLGYELLYRVVGYGARRAGRMHSQAVPDRAQAPGVLDAQPAILRRDLVGHGQTAVILVVSKTRHRRNRAP